MGRTLREARQRRVLGFAEDSVVRRRRDVSPTRPRGRRGWRGHPALCRRPRHAHEDRPNRPINCHGEQEVASMTEKYDEEMEQAAERTVEALNAIFGEASPSTVFSEPVQVGRRPRDHSGGMGARRWLRIRRWRQCGRERQARGRLGRWWRGLFTRSASSGYPGHGGRGGSRTCHRLHQDRSDSAHRSIGPLESVPSIGGTRDRLG